MLGEECTPGCPPPQHPMSLRGGGCPPRRLLWMGGVGGPRLDGSKERAGRVREVRAPMDMCPLSPLSLGLGVLKSWLPADRQWGHQGEGPIALGVQGIGWGLGYTLLVP